MYIFILLKIRRPKTRLPSLLDSGYRYLFREQSGSGLKLTILLYLFLQPRINALFDLPHLIGQNWVNRDNFTFQLSRL